VTPGAGQLDGRERLCQRDLQTPLAAGGATALTVLVAAMVIGWVVLVVIYIVFFRHRG
jgi:hypothetical protein